MEGLVLGTPDMYGAEGDTLFVTDGKTKDPEGSITYANRRESWGIYQLKLYAYKILVNHDGADTIKKVVLRSELYGRLEYVKQSVENGVVKFGDDEYDTLTLIKHAQIILNEKLHT